MKLCMCFLDLVSNKEPQVKDFGSHACIFKELQYDMKQLCMHVLIGSPWSYVMTSCGCLNVLRPHTRAGFF